MSGRLRDSRSNFLKIALSVLVGLGLVPSCAEAEGTLPNFYVGTGVIAHQIFKASGSETGSTTPIASIEPEIHIAMKIPLGGDQWAFMPSVAFTALGRTTQDEAAKIRLLPLSFDFVRNFGKFELRAGPGILSTIVSGEGGTVRLDNGTSTSEFARPSGTSTATTLYVTLGAGGYVAKKIRVDGSLLMQSIASERRTFSVMGQVSYEIF